MWSIVVCDGNKAEREQILEYLRLFSNEKKRRVQVQGAEDWSALFELLQQAEPDIIIIAQDGVEGLNTLTNIHLPPKKFVWFSDLDFSLQAYRLCVGWFGKKPVTYQKMIQALTQCIKEAPPTARGVQIN